MTVKEKKILMAKQTELMHERAGWELLQTEFSGDESFYDYCQKTMDSLDVKAEDIRSILEGVVPR